MKSNCSKNLYPNLSFSLRFDANKKSNESCIKENEIKLI